MISSVVGLITGILCGPNHWGRKCLNTENCDLCFRYVELEVLAMSRGNVAMQG